MKRSGPPVRRTPLVNRSQIKATPFRRVTPVAPIRPKARPAGVTADTTAIVDARAGLTCERCGASLAGGGGHRHHRRPRGMGGSRAVDTNRASNILRLCVGCHEWVESNRGKARRLGLLVDQGANPARVPVVLLRGRVILDDVGGWRSTT